MELSGAELLQDGAYNSPLSPGVRVLCDPSASDPTVREAAYRFASLVILADQEVNDLERRWLDRLAEAYRLGAERKVELEAELFGA